MASQLSSTKTFNVGSIDAAETAPHVQKLSKDEVERIKKAIENASSLEEVARLEKMLQSGRVPRQ